MNRPVVILTILGVVLGCEDSSTMPDDGDDSPSASIPYVEPLTYVSVNATAPFIGQPFARQFSALGGRPPYRWSIGQGAFAAGLTLSESGLLTGTTRAPAPYSYSVLVTDAAGTTQESPMTFGTPNRGGTVVFTHGPVALRVVGQRGDAGYQPFLQGGTPPFTFSVAGLPPGLAMDPATGVISGRAATVGDYTLSITLRDATGAVAFNSPTVAPVLVVAPERSVGSTTAGSRYAGTWTGMFSLQYRMCPASYGVILQGGSCDRYVGSALVRQTAAYETGVIAVKVWMTVEGIGPTSSGFSVFAVKRVTLSHAAFGCHTGCTPAAGSVLVLQDPVPNQRTTNAIGLVLIGPNHSFSLSTANATGAVHMSLAGSTLSNSLDPEISTDSWGAMIGEDAFEDIVLPRLSTQPEARVTQTNWVLSKGTL